MNIIKTNFVMDLTRNRQLKQVDNTSGALTQNCRQLLIIKRVLQPSHPLLDCLTNDDGKAQWPLNQPLEDDLSHKFLGT